MHELFANVLATLSLSRAGELFSLEDKAIVGGLTDVVSCSFHLFMKENWLRYVFMYVTAAFGNIHDHFTTPLFGSNKRSISD